MNDVHSNPTTYYIATSQAVATYPFLIIKILITILSNLTPQISSIRIESLHLVNKWARTILTGDWYEHCPTPSEHKRTRSMYSKYCGDPGLSGVSTPQPPVEMYCYIPDVDACVLRPCLNNGTCVPETDGYTCKCKPDFSGSRCQSGTYILIRNQFIHWVLIINLINTYPDHGIKGICS